MVIYHNPRCGKSRAALQYLQNKGIQPEIRLYLTDNPDEDEIRKLLEKLRIPAEAIVRKNEQIYKEHYGNKILTNDEYIDALVKYPVLIQRPIIIMDDKALVCRTEESLKEIK